MNLCTFYLIYFCADKLDSRCLLDRGVVVRGGLVLTFRVSFRVVSRLSCASLSLSLPIFGSTVTTVVGSGCCSDHFVDWSLVRVLVLELKLQHLSLFYRTLFV